MTDMYDMFEYIQDDGLDLDDVVSGHPTATRELVSLRGVLADLYALVEGECPALLDDDRDGDSKREPGRTITSGSSKLALRIEELLK